MGSSRFEEKTLNLGYIFFRKVCFFKKMYTQGYFWGRNHGNVTRSGRETAGGFPQSILGYVQEIAPSL